MSATTRLYYTDSTLTEFAAAVVVADPADGCVAVQLDRTACYPTSGGQPNDTGSLGSGRVVDVVDSWVRRARVAPPVSDSRSQTTILNVAVSSELASSLPPGPDESITL